MHKLGLRTKFFLYSNSLILVTMTVVTALAVIQERRSLYQVIESRGVSLTEALAIPISDALANEELGRIVEQGLIDNYIAEIQARNRDLMRYVVVSDEQGLVTHSNRWAMVGKRFERFPDPDTAGGRPVVEILEETMGERMFEVRTTLGEATRQRGSIAVGFSLDLVDRRASLIGFQVAGVGLLLLLGNSALTGLYVETLIRPILQLHQAIGQAGRGDLSVRSAMRRGDEVGDLSGAFNRLMDQLEQAGDLDKTRQTQLAHTEKMAAVGTLAAGVAHEVNNPLGGILTCIENMRLSPDDVKMRERYLELIHEGLKRIERTVANLLNFSRERRVHLEPTSINHNLRHVMELVEFQARQRQVEVQLRLHADEPLVMADHLQMEQLFLNLVLNALQAMKDGGTLTLRTIVRDSKVVAEVADDGIGIPDQIRDRIFDPFFTTREVGEGTGLGLAVSDSIVAAHGGSIEVNSTEGEGSVFRVIFARHTRMEDGE